MSICGDLDLRLDYSHSSVRKSNRNLPDLADVALPNKVSFVNRELDPLSKKLVNLGIRISAKTFPFSRVARVPVKNMLAQSLTMLGGLESGRVQVHLADGIGDETEVSMPLARDVYAIGYFQTKHFFSRLIQEDTLTTSTFKGFVEQEICNWRQLKPEKSVLIHVRRGDYLDSNFGNLSIEYYRKAFEYVTEKYNIDHIYAISDDESECAVNRIKNVSSNIQFISSRSLSAAQVLGLMAQFKILIGANSSLSWWAAALAGTVNETIAIFPNPWFTNGNSPSNLIMKSWHTLGGDVWEEPGSVK